MATPTFSVFISHVPIDISKKDLRQVFSHCGAVRDVYIKTVKADQLWTYGFVRFSTLVEALKAVKEMDGWHLKDQRIRVELAKAIDKSCLDEMLSENKSLPAVNPSVQPSANHQESNVDKIVNINRLQDICCMINCESNQSKDKIYVVKIMETIEQLKCSSKLPAMDIKLSEKASNSFNSDLTKHLKQLSSSTFDQFKKNHAEVDEKLQMLLSKNNLSKSANAQSRKHYRSASPKRSSSGTKSVDNNTLLTKSPLKSDKVNSPKEVAQNRKMKQVKQNCDDGKTNAVTVSGSVSSSLLMKNTTSSSNMSSLPGDFHSTYSSEGFESSLQEVSQFSQRFHTDLETQKHFEDESDTMSLSKEQNSDGFAFISKTFGNLSEESWEEGEENIPRKNRSKWASELFIQILSDDSSSSTAADDKSLSSSQKYPKKYSSMLSSF